MFVNSSTEHTLYINMVDALKQSGGSGNCEVCINPKDGDHQSHSKLYLLVASKFIVFPLR